VHELTQRRNHNVAAVALANKIARTVYCGRTTGNSGLTTRPIAAA
jgi:transposase